MKVKSIPHFTVCLSLLEAFPDCEDLRQMNFKESYQSANSRCSSSDGTILNIFNHLDNLVHGREYWSNIVRSKFLKWATHDSFDDICYELGGLVNVDCVFLTVAYRDVKYIPLPCKYKCTAICKTKRPGDQAVIRQCQTSNNTTTSAGDQPDPEDKPVLTPKTLSTKTVHLTNFVSTTSDHKSTKDTLTNYVSTKLEYPNLFTQDQSFSMTRFVSVSSSVSSSGDTTGIKRTEHNTLTVPLDTNENRTIANETTNTDLFYITMFSLAGVGFFGLVIITLLFVVRRRVKKDRSEGNGGRQPHTKIENRPYEHPWEELTMLNIGIPECKLYDTARGQSSPECQIYDVAKDHYHHLDFDTISKQCKFVETEYDVSMQTASMPMPEMHYSSSNNMNNAMPNCVSRREEKRRTSSDFFSLSSVM